MQGPEGRPPNVSPARKGWEIDPEEDPSAVGAALNRSYALPVSADLSRRAVAGSAVPRTFVEMFSAASMASPSCVPPRRYHIIGTRRLRCSASS
jgi:hypothetical protein